MAGFAPSTFNAASLNQTCCGSQSWRNENIEGNLSWRFASRSDDLADGVRDLFRGSVRGIIRQMGVPSRGLDLRVPQEFADHRGTLYSKPGLSLKPGGRLGPWSQSDQNLLFASIQEGHHRHVARVGTVIVAVPSKKLFFMDKVTIGAVRQSFSQSKGTHTVMTSAYGCLRYGKLFTGVSALKIHWLIAVWSGRAEPDGNW